MTKQSAKPQVDEGADASRENKAMKAERLKREQESKMSL